MKKILCSFLIILLIIPFSVYAITDDEVNNSELTEETKLNKKETVTLEECVDITTVKLRNNNDEIFKVKLLAIDATTDEDILNDAKQYMCNALVNANKLVIEYDSKGKEEDSYGRKLVWLFTDDVLLQNQLVLNGYASVNGVYELYEYTSMLNDSQLEAKKNEVGMWKVKNTNLNSEPEKNKKTKKNFFRNIIDNLLGAVLNFINDILDKILNLIEDML